jgi:hypothetical protein
MNQLQALAMNEGKRWKQKLWSEQGRAAFEKLPLGFWASRRRQELLELLGRMNPTIEELTTAVEREAKKRPDAAVDDASWRGSAYGTRLGADHRNSDTVPSWQADWDLRGDDSVRGLQCSQATAGAHQQARQFLIAFLVGGSGPGSSACSPGLETSLHTPGDASA